MTAQYNNARQDANLLETVFTTSNVASTFGATKAQFLVDASALPTYSPPFVNNPVYTQPLYATNVTVASGTFNALFLAALNGEVCAYNADNTSSPTKLWYRDETNTATGMQGLKHNCDVTGFPGTSFAYPLPFLQFAGVVSTPVIELNASGAELLYIVNLCERTSDGSEHWYLNALNIHTGANYASPAEIAYSSSQVSANPYGPHQQFFAPAQLQRASLLAVSGTVGGTVYKSLIAGFGTSTYEGGPNAMNYQGWTFAYDANPSDSTFLTLNYNANSGGYVAYALPSITQCEYPPETVGTPYCNYDGTGNPPSSTIPNPCGDGGGVWMSARALAANADADVFYAAGNGGFNYCKNCTNTCAGLPSHTWQYFTDYGEAVLETPMEGVWSTQPTSSSSMQAAFWPTSYFVPDVIPTGVTNPNNCGSSGSGACTYFQVLNENDWDMGVSGVMIFDDNHYTGSTTEHNVGMALAATKRGDSYVLLQSDLGQYQYPDASVARFNISSSNPNCSSIGSTGICDEPRTLAYWNPNGSSGDGFLVAWPWNETAASFQWLLSGSQYTFQSVSTASNPFSGLGSGDVTGYAGGALALTFNLYDESPAAAVVWAVAAPYPNASPHCGQMSGVGCLGYLLAYKLSGSTGDLSSNQIWPSTLPSAPDFATAPYAIPTTVNGKVYVPTYGLCKQFNGSGTCIASDGYTLSGVQVYGF